MGRGIKDFLIALAIGTFADFIGHLIQYLAGGNHWLPDGPTSFTFWMGAYWFSRYPIAERR